MANVIQVKRNVYTGTGNPAAANVAYGELAWNNGNGAENAGELWIGQQTGTSPVVIAPRRLNKSVLGTTSEITVVEAAESFTVSLPDDVTVGNDLVVTGDLTVSGDTITANVATITIEDKTIELGKAATPTDTTANGSGIITTGTSSDVKSILYSSTDDRWVSNKRFDAPTFVGDLTGDVTGDVTGTAANVTGTVAIANGGTGAANAGAARTALGVDAAGTDNSTDVTLATVTSNYLSLSGQAITAGTIPVALGGTGATTAGDARTALGIDAAGTINYVHPNHTGDVTSLAGGVTAIAAGVIVDADVKSDASIAYSKLGTIPTWNQDTTGNAATVTNGLYTSSTIDGGTF